MWVHARRRVGDPAGSAGGRLRCRGRKSDFPKDFQFLYPPGPDFIYTIFSGGRGLDFIYINFSGSRGLDLTDTNFCTKKALRFLSKIEKNYL